MLTPVDIQQKKFNIGLGYDKKDVNTFFQSVAESYEQLYRLNAELKEKVETLTDGLQHYKSKEEALEKSLLRAEKDSEDTKSRANKEAKNIELEAKNKAKMIVGEAEERLEQIKLEMAELETRYAAYKSNFATMLKKQAEFLGEVDFDVDAQIDDRAFVLIAGSMPQQAAPAGGGAFGTFDGDPQMRDESSLGGMNAGGGGMMGSGGDVNSTSAVYTSMLSANENFVDPFNPNKEEPGRYNPYDGRTVTKKTKSGGQKFTVNSGGKNRVRRNTGETQAPKKEESASTPSVDDKIKEDVSSASTQSTAQSTAQSSTQSSSQNNKSQGIKVSTVPEELKEKLRQRGFEHPGSQTSSTMSESSETIPTVDFSSTTEDSSPTEEQIEVEINIPESSLLGDGDDSDKETDEFGFEFV